MRVIAGSAKGTRLSPVPRGTRPVSDRAREGIFASLGDRVAGARVLDLFAGTGAMGIEALSRGAAEAVFVDSAAAAVATVRENLRRTRLGEAATVRRDDVLRFVRGRSGTFDLVVVDPPYALAKRALDTLLAELAAAEAVSAGGTVVLTRPSGSYTPVIPVNWLADRQLSYGDTVVLLLGKT